MKPNARFYPKGWKKFQDRHFQNNVHDICQTNPGLRKPCVVPAACKTKHELIEKIQIKFIKTMCQKYRFNYDRKDSAELCEKYSISTLKDRRDMSDLLFIFKAQE